jgi:hypothetical protein
MTPEQEKQYLDDAFAGKVPARGAVDEKEWNERYEAGSVEDSTAEPATDSTTDSAQLEERLQSLRAIERGYKTRRRAIPTEEREEIRQEKRQLKALLRARQ